MAIIDGNELLNQAGLALTPPTLPNTRTNSAAIQVVNFVVEISATDNATSKWKLAALPSNASIQEIKIANTAITGFTSGDIGIYNHGTTALGAVISGAALSAAASYAASTSNAYTANGLSAVTPSNNVKQVWQMAGLTKDPIKLLDIGLLANTIGTTAGTIAGKIYYTVAA
jgi:hypothetical protein